MALYAIEQRASRIYQRKIMSVSLWNIVLKLFGGKAHLKSMSDYRANRPIAAQHELGVQAIPVKQIRGSVNRHRDYDKHFVPNRDNNAVRWQRVCTAYLAGKGLPAIDVYKIDDIYFVEDGHNRVSVARALEHSYIDARIIEITLAEPRQPQSATRTTITQLTPAVQT